MNVAKMAMPRDVAREKLRAVRSQLHKHADAEYVQLEAAYRAAANGKPLISLSLAIADAPRDEKGRPRLAIARADRVQVRFFSSTDRATFDAVRRGESFWRVRERSLGRVTTQCPGIQAAVPNGFALVPIVPPDVRGNHSLATHHILWEVETWADTQIRARPDIDPYLLKHIGGDLYAVVAEWDLTDIERAVMAGRARN